MEHNKPSQPLVYKQDPPPDPKKETAEPGKNNQPAEDVEEKSPAIEPPKMSAESKKEQTIVNEQEQNKITNDIGSPVAGEEENK